MKVGEVMNKVLVVEENTKLRHASKIMSDKNIGCLLVLRKDKIIGIITEGDVLKNINKLESKVDKVMTKNVITIEEGDTLDHAAELMAEHKIKKLPVLDDNKLVGIITATDIIANVDKVDEDFYFD